METVIGLFSGAAAASGSTAAATTAATAAPAVAATAAPAFSLSQILSGGATLLSAVSAISAGAAQADALEAQATDTEMQKPLEVIQGLERRNEIKRATMQAVADIDTATAAGGADLSFGTPSVARRQAQRQGDYAANSNAWTTGATIDRLELRKKTYLQMAGRARMAGLVDGLATGFSGFARLYDTRRPV